MFRRCRRRASPAHVRCGRGLARATRRCRSRSAGSPPRWFRRRFACRSPARFPTRGAAPAPQRANEHDLVALRAPRGSPRGQDRRLPTRDRSRRPEYADATGGEGAGATAPTRLRGSAAQPVSRTRNRGGFDRARGPTLDGCPGERGIVTETAGSCRLPSCGSLQPHAPARPRRARSVLACGRGHRRRAHARGVSVARRDGRDQPSVPGQRPATTSRSSRNMPDGIIGGVVHFQRESPSGKWWTMASAPVRPWIFWLHWNVPKRWAARRSTCAFSSPTAASSSPEAPRTR